LRKIKDGLDLERCRGEAGSRETKKREKKKKKNRTTKKRARVKLLVEMAEAIAEGN
jgi:hypothetical protein